jgi:hypothetical protein
MSLTKVTRKPFKAYLFGLMIFFIFFAFSLQYKGPIHRTDEMAYMSKAAAIAGYVTDRANPWYAGYSLLLAPLFHVFSDPFLIWKGVLFLNAVMWGLSFVVLFHVLTHLFPNKEDAQILEAMSICAIYPAFITMSSYAFATSAFSFFFMLALWTIIKYQCSGNLLWHFVSALLIGYLYWIHPTGLGIAAAYVILLLFEYKRNWKNILLQLITIACMILAYQHILHPWLNSIMDFRDHTGHEYLSARKMISYFFDIKNTSILIICLFGQYVYFTVSTLGIFHSFLIDFCRRIKENYRRISLHEIDFWIPAFVCLSFFFIVLMGAMSLVAHTNIQDTIPSCFLLHGRYPEHIVLPLLGILLLSYNQKIKISAAFILLLSGYLYWIPFLKVVPDFNPVNLTAYWPVVFRADFYSAALVSTLVVLLACYMKKKFVKVMLVISYIICIFYQKSSHYDALEFYSRTLELTDYIRETFPQGTTIAFDLRSLSLDARNRLLNYQSYAYFLYDYDYRRMTGEEWDNLSEGVFLTYTPEDYTTGKSGHLVFGPYLPLKAGKYHLTIKGKVTTLDKAFVDVVSDQAKVEHLRGTPLKSEDDVIFQDTFDINVDVTDYEVRIFAGENDVIRFDSYILEKIETGS